MMIAEFVTLREVIDELDDTADAYQSSRLVNIAETLGKTLDQLTMREQAEEHSTAEYGQRLACLERRVELLEERYRVTQGRCTDLTLQLSLAHQGITRAAGMAAKALQKLDKLDPEKITQRVLGELRVPPLTEADAITDIIEEVYEAILA